MNEIIMTKGFGVPNTIDPHHFILTIPLEKDEDIIISENFGITAYTKDLDILLRCHLKREIWKEIADEVKRVFNDRLKSKNIKTSTWSTGDNMIERLLGKELCILVWALEVASPNLCPIALRYWINFKPEERWWLFKMVDQTIKDCDDIDKGWKKALRIALTESPNPGHEIQQKIKKTKKEKEKELDLFS